MSTKKTCCNCKERTERSVDRSLASAGLIGIPVFVPPSRLLLKELEMNVYTPRDEEQDRVSIKWRLRNPPEAREEGTDTTHASGGALGAEKTTRKGDGWFSAAPEERF